jgi:hypothetical protein
MAALRQTKQNAPLSLQPLPTVFWYGGAAALSPDDSKLAVCNRDPQVGTRDIWIFDPHRGGKMRLTFDPAQHVNPNVPSVKPL